MTVVPITRTRDSIENRGALLPWDEAPREAMKPGTLLIRADASLAIGTGHVMRCLALAQAWQSAGGKTCLVATELPDALTPRVTEEGVTLAWIRANAGSSEDADETVTLARRIGADWVVIDGDRFGSDFLATVRGAGFRVLLIDDFADRESFPADVIVNPDLDDDGLPYRKRGATAQLLLGPSYILLRREFKQEIEKETIRKAGNRILVTLGGSDPENLSPQIASSLAACPDLETTVVAGAGFNNVDQLFALRSNKLRVIFNPPNMAQFMKEADVAIVVAGGTLWELLSMGCSVLSYSRNSPQARVIQSLSRRGVVVDMGRTDEFNSSRLVASVKELVASSLVLERMASLGRALVDGLGAGRVIEVLQRTGSGQMLPMSASEQC
jgi:UDP-2,4-diacetamido-2,4,6-trideoxy-beta-L-altropyranose hydrolase